MNLFSTLRQHAGLLVLCAIFMTLGFFRLNDLTIYSPDSTRYVIWGTSVAEGKGFVDQTSPDPERFVVQGPLYPVLLAPVMFFSPRSLLAAKIWTLMMGVVAVVLFYAWCLRSNGKNTALGAALLFAFNPLTIIYSTEVLSEAPFIAAMILVFILADKMFWDNRAGKGMFAAFVLAVAGAALLREAGIALFLASLVLLIMQKKPVRAMILAAVVVGLLVLWYIRNNYWIGPSGALRGGNAALIFQHIVTSSATPMANEFALRLWIGLKEYAAQLGGMLLFPLYLARQFNLTLVPSVTYELMYGFMTSVGKFLVILVGIPLLFGGIAHDMKYLASAPLKVLFFAFYLVIILLYPVHDLRFLFPFLPLLIFYHIGAIRWFLVSASPQAMMRRRMAVAVMSVLFMIPNIMSVAQVMRINTAYRSSPEKFFQVLHRLPSYPVMFTQSWSTLGKWIQEHLPDSVTIASPSKNLATVVGERKVIDLDQGVPLPLFEAILRDYQVQYLLAPLRGNDLHVFEFHMEESRRFWFESVYTQGGFELFRIHSSLLEPDGRMPLAGAQDSLSVGAYVREGRRALIDGAYPAAIAEYRRAYTLDSTNVEVLYQLLTAYAQQGDSANVSRMYQRLFLLPQALGYVLPARTQLQGMKMLAEARDEKFSQAKAVKSYQTAAFYWKQGYYHHAMEIMDVMLHSDSTYFVGLLWGFHYNLQMGDTARAKRYLSILDGIDRQNAVVQAFHQMISVGDSLNRSTDPLFRSRQHLKLATLYGQMELFDESLDEAERAVRDNPANNAAQISRGELFLRRGKPRPAISSFEVVLAHDPSQRDLQARIDSLSRSVYAN